MTDWIKTEILIVGGGAVGLFLAIRLLQLGHDVLVVEQKTERSKHSRSIGIHPPSLEYLEEMGLADSFIEKGLCISKGLAIGDHGLIGELDFSTCPPPYPFILTLPQFHTETILENYLTHNYQDSLLKGIKLVDFKQDSRFIQAKVQNQESDFIQISADFMVGCDGNNSGIRKKLNIKFNGASYDDTFIMGDFEDSTTFGPVAAIYLQSKGLIESFPLPENKRRWVIRTPEYIPSPTADLLADSIEPRTGFSISTLTNSMISSFGVQHYLATSFGRGRIGIIGDAAHIVSPFGGQGMNLGWMDAWELSKNR